MIALGLAIVAALLARAVKYGMRVPDEFEPDWKLRTLGRLGWLRYAEGSSEVEVPHFEASD